MTQYKKLRETKSDVVASDALTIYIKLKPQWLGA